MPFLHEDFFIYDFVPREMVVPKGPEERLKKKSNYLGPLRSLKRGKKRMTTQSRLQSRQQRKTLFAQGRQIATNTAKSLRARQTAEAARHLLLHFDHAQIALGQIVVKIHPQIFQEAEDRFLMFAHTVEQIACGTLFDSPFGPRRGRRSWSDLIAFIKQAEKGNFPSKHFQRIEPALSLFSCLLGRLLHREEQFFELGRPDGSLLLCLKHQLSEKMNQAKSMLTVIQEVRCPGIMDADAFEDRQDANRVQRVLSSALIHMIMGEGRRCQRQSRFGSSWFLVNHCKMLLYLICSCTNLLQEVAQNADYATVSLTRRTGNDLDQRDIGATARACDLAPFQFALPTLFVFVNDIG